MAKPHEGQKGSSGARVCCHWSIHNAHYSDADGNVTAVLNMSEKFIWPEFEREAGFSQ